MGTAVSGDRRRIAEQMLGGIAFHTGVPAGAIIEFLSKPHDRWNAINQAMDRFGIAEEEIHRLLEGRGAVPGSTRSPEGSEEMSEFKVTKEAGSALLVELGFKQAPNYNAVRLQERLSKLDTIVDGADSEDAKKVKTPGSKKLLAAVLGAIERGEEITVVGKGDKPEKAAAASDEKPAKKAKQAEPEEEEKPKKKAGKEKAEKAAPEKKAKKPGVCATIRECLENASEKKPATKEGILKVLVKRFPEREERAMKSTVGGFPSWAPSYFKVKLKDDGEGGYWIAGAK